MSSIEEKIRILGQKKEFGVLREYISTLETDTLTQIVSRKVHNQSFISFFKYLLEGLDDSPESHDKRFAIFTAIIKSSQVTAISTMQLKNLLSALSAELYKLRTDHLIEMCGMCVEFIQKGNTKMQSWNDLLPILLHIIVEREHVEYNGEDMTGSDYKTQLIQSLLMMEWSPNIITSLTNMFITMPLTKEEHTQVVNKLAQSMETLIPQEIPAFVYQLLKLCKNQNGCLVFLRMQNYFGLRVYSKKNFNQLDSESLDSIGDASDMYAQQAESTVLFHINEAAVNGDDSINDYLNSLKKLTKSPEFILHPFHLTVLLTISTVTFYEEKVYEILKAAVFRSFAENHKKNDSCWFREMVPTSQNISNIFQQIIHLSLQERNLVLQGLINFSFILLGTSAAFGKEAMAEKMWDVGKLIILRLIKRKRSTAEVIVQKLVNHIITEHNVYQYIECLHLLSKKYGLVLLENQSCIIELMERLINVPRQQPDEILEALIPLTGISFTLRDHLILLLRKGLFSRSIYTRQMAVTGFLKLIKALKFSVLSALSQSSSCSLSDVSVMTQISLTQTRQSKPNTFTNEALCLEVVSILRRCFIQQAEVKYKLYEGLQEAVSTNSDLGIPVLELMWSHFNQFYVFDEDATLAIQFDKLFQTKDMDVILLEPLGKLLYMTGLILNKQLENMNSDPVIDRFRNGFEKISQKMSQCELEHLQLNDGTDLTDVLPESQQKLLLLKETISIYEALIGFNILSWNESSENKANLILQLFNAYNRFMQFGKSSVKPKKDDKNKNLTKSVTQNETTRSDGSTSKKLFKPPPTVIDFQCLDKMLQLLHKPSVPWTSVEEAKTLRKNVEFNRYAMLTTISLFQRAKQLKHLTEDKRVTYYKYCKSIGTLLFTRCVSRFSDFSNFDNTLAFLSVEAFHVLMQVVNSKFKDKWSSFLGHATTHSNDEVNLHQCLDVYKKLFETMDEDTPQDAETQKYYQTVVQSLSILSEQIPINSNNPSLLEWLKMVLSKENIKSKQVCNIFVEFTFDMHVRFKTTTTLLRNVALNLNNVLGSICEEATENLEQLSIVTHTNAGNILSILCNVIKQLLDDIDWIILRLTSEFMMINYPGEDCIERRKERLKGKERGVCCHICQIISIMTVVGDITITSGNYSESIIKISTHLYTTLTNLTKHFIVRSNKVNIAFQSARFESVVKQTGKKLSPVMYRFILDQQKQSDGQTQSEDKKKVDSNKLKMKILKQTRSIPKLVYEMEQFSKAIILLSNKTKADDIAKYVGQGTTRDFRILRTENTTHDSTRNETTELDDSLMDADTMDGNDSEEEEPVTKRKKK